MNGVPLDPDEQTLGDYLRGWLQNAKRPAIRLATFRLYSHVIEYHIIPIIGAVHLRKLAPANVQELMARLSASEVSGRSQQIVLAVLNVALRQALKWNLIARNPCDVIERPRADHREIRVLTTDQVRLLLQAAANDRLYALSVLAVSTGLRQGELLALRWQDIDQDIDLEKNSQKGSLSVCHTLSRDKTGRLVLSEPKTVSSRRKVILPTLAVRALREHQKRLLAEGLRSSPWVFPSRKRITKNRFDGNGEGDQSRPIDKDGLRNRSFKPLLKRAGLPDIRFHDLRHTAATMLLSPGVHPRIAQERLGHSQIRTTLRTYSHVLPSMQEEAAARLDALLGA